MPWRRSEPDPLKERRRRLAEQERLLAERMLRLTEELNGAGAPVVPEKKTSEPPVWRMEDESARRSPREAPPSGRKTLGRQRQRDMIIFFLCTALLLAIVGVVFWLWKTHVPSPD